VYQSGVPVVLDRVVRATQKEVGDLRPTIIEVLVKEEEYPIFFNRPSDFLQKRVELVVPALAALLAGSPRHRH